MKLQDYRETSYFYSGKASEIARQLSFAGIGLIWLFKSGDVAGGAALPQRLMLPTALICLALAVDLVQYVMGYLIWTNHFRRLEKSDIPENEDLARHSELMVLPISVCFWLKIALVIAAYLAIGRFMYDGISFS